MPTPQEALETFRTTLLSGDLDKVFEWIDEDAVVYFSNETCHDGKPAIRAAFEENARVIKNDTYDIGDLRWLLCTEVAAVCVYSFSWEGEVAGERASGRGRGTTALRCVDGSWKIVHEHLSKGPSQ